MIIRRHFFIIYNINFKIELYIFRIFILLFFSIFLINNKFKKKIEKTKCNMRIRINFFNLYYNTKLYYNK